MSKSTLPVSGEAMPKISRAAVMTKAWEIFRKAYDNPARPFAKFSRKHNFGYCLCLAWQETKAATAQQTDMERRKERLRSQINFAHTSDDWGFAKRTIAACKAELASISSAALIGRIQTWRETM